MSSALRLILPLLLCWLATQFSLSTSGAAEEIPGLKKIEQGLEKHESELEKLERGMKIHLGKLQVIGEEEFNLLGQIEQLDKRLALQKIKLDVMVERLNSQEELFATRTRELEKAEEESREVREHLQKRLRAFYLMGRTGILNVTFSTRTLPELMVFNDSFMTLINYDKKLFDQFRETIHRLTSARDAHEKERILLNEFIEAAVQEQQQLDTLLVEKRNLLKRVKTQKILHEQAIKELRKAEAELRDTLAALQKRRAYTLKGFTAGKGTMPSPVRGKLLSRFGEAKSGDGIGSGPSQGITIDAPNGAKVRAIFAGKVLFAGYRKGFGNMVIIDHGLDYVSITARIEKITVKEGQEVEAGHVIGIAGDLATLFEKGVYFEIRHETEPVDPLAWVRMEER